jgi:hypothetical protein
MSTVTPKSHHRWRHRPKMVEAKIRISTKFTETGSVQSLSGHWDCCTNRGCREYGYPWIYPCVDILFWSRYGYIHGYFSTIQSCQFKVQFELAASTVTVSSVLTTVGYGQSFSPNTAVTVGLRFFLITTHEALPSDTVR